MWSVVSPARSLVAALIAASLGCNAKSPESEHRQSAANAPQAEQAPQKAAEPTTPKPPPLSDEDKRLLAADPATLTPEERRKRSYALRRKIMQDPDSSAARMLHDLEDAVRDGDIDPNGKGNTLSLPGTRPENARPPAGWRPPEDEAPEGDGS